MSEKVDYEEHVDIFAKISYGSASSAHVYLSGIGLGVIDIFYLKFTTIDPALMALSWILFIVWNMLNDPIIGIFQDKTKTDIGRRIPYLRYGAPIYAISFIWIWFPFTNMQDLLFLNHLLMLFIFDTVHSMMALIFYAMPAEMALTSKERGSIMVYNAALCSLGAIGSIIVPVQYLGGVPDFTGFRIAMIISGILSGFVIFLSSFSIKENEWTQMEDTLGFFESIKETFKNKPFLIVQVTIFSMIIMQQIITGYFLFLFDYIIDFNFENPLNIGFLMVVGVMVSISIYWLLSHIEKLKNMIIVGSGIAIFGFASLLIISLVINVNQANKMPLWMVFIPLTCIIIGLLSSMLLGQPLLADCIDYDEVLTGKRRETTYTGISALITKPAVSVGRVVFLLIISFYGYNNSIVNPNLQPLSVATGVILAFTLVPMICLIIGLMALKFYPLDGKEWMQTKRNLQEKHFQKEKEYIEYLKKIRIT